MDTINLIKVISALIYPVGLLFASGLLWLVLRWADRPRLSQLFGTAFVLVLILTTNPLVARWLVSGLEDQFPQLALDEIQRHDAIIVLGGGLRIPIPPAQHPQLSHGSDRFWYATRLYRAGKANKILVAGGNVFAQPGLYGEAFYIKELLQQWGVPGGSIVIETNSRTTRQNLENVERLLQQEQVSSVLLVTSAIHMPRAYELFQQLPIKVTPASADVLVRDAEMPLILKWIPSSGSLELSTVALHEHYGRTFNQISRAWNAVIESF